MLAFIRRVRYSGCLNDENMKKIYYITRTLLFVAIFSYIIFFLLCYFFVFVFFFFALFLSRFFSPFYAYVCSCQHMTAGRFYACFLGLYFLFPAADFFYISRLDIVFMCRLLIDDRFY